MADKRSLSFILSEIGSVMDQLLDTSQKKLEILVDQDLAGLEKLIPAEQELVHRLSTLEDERMATDDCDDSEVAHLKAALREKAEKITEINERNRGLLRKGLDLVEYELKLLFSEGRSLVFDHRA